MPDGMKLPSGVFYMGPGFVCVGKDAMAGSLPHDGSKFMLLTVGSAGGEYRHGSSPLGPVENIFYVRVGNGVFRGYGSA